MLETSRAKKWLYDVLKNDSALSAVVGERIYDKQAPQGATRPFVIFVYLTGDDLQGIGTERTMARPFYAVKMVGDAPLTEAEKDGADRIDEIVGKTSGVAYDGYVFHARRTQEVDYAENDPLTSKRVDHLGGIFQVWTYPAT